MQSHSLRRGTLEHFQLIAAGLPISGLLEAIEANPDLWDEITARQTTPGSPHKYTRAIFLRWAKEQTISAAFKDLTVIDYPALERLPDARGFIALVAAFSEAVSIGRVMVVSLDPGGVIFPHCDEGDYADHFERFHICLQSDDGNAFLTEVTNDAGEFVHMLPGEMWFFNHKARHMLMNASARPRLHLIVDVVAPQYRRERHDLSA